MVFTHKHINILSPNWTTVRMIRSVANKTGNNWNQSIFSLNLCRNATCRIYLWFSTIPATAKTRRICLCTYFLLSDVFAQLQVPETTTSLWFNTVHRVDERTIWWGFEFIDTDKEKRGKGSLAVAVMRIRIFSYVCLWFASMIVCVCVWLCERWVRV